MMEKLKILWVTADCFIDHDIQIVPLVSQKVFINWIILFNNENNRYTKKNINDTIRNCPNISVDYLRFKYRSRYPQNVIVYNKIYDLYKKYQTNIIHLDCWQDSPWIIPLMQKLPIEKTILVAHHGEVHDGFKHKRVCNLLRRIVFSKIKYVKMFSKSQASLFERHFPSAKLYVFKLPLIGEGNPTNSRQVTPPVLFLSFGGINYAKNVELLADAACNLYEKGYRDFKVVIKGNCSDKESFMQHVKYPEVIEADLRFIDNSEIPDMFNSCHFFVQPYRIVTQSGPFKIAMNYNVPLITSNLPGFTDEMVEGVTGFTFKSEDVKSLEDVMIKAIKIAKDKTKYETLRSDMLEYVEKTYSNETLSRQYIEMFNDIIQSSQI